MRPSFKIALVLASAAAWSATLSLLGAAGLSDRAFSLVGHIMQPWPARFPDP